jgi:hypothetical protein
MGEDLYVKELRQGAVGVKLPTLLDLAPKKESSFSSRFETPTGNYAPKNSEASNPEVKRVKTPQEISLEIAAKIRKLHYDGRRLDEVYELLESEGYNYSDIEPVLVEFLDKNRSQAKGAMPQNRAGVSQEQNPAAQNMQPRVFVNRQFSNQGNLPQQRPASTAQPSPTFTQGVRPDLPRPPIGPQNKGIEVVELNAISPSRLGNEEVPTNIQKQYGPANAQVREENVNAGVSSQAPDSLGGNDFAPLFVKVGKYRETLEALNDLANYLRAMERLFEMVEELEKIRQMNISALDKMHKKALATAEKLSSGLLKPKGMSLEGTRESDVELNKLGDVMSDLSKELTMLKKEVDKLNRLE